MAEKLTVNHKHFSRAIKNKLPNKLIGTLCCSASAVCEIKVLEGLDSCRAPGEAKCFMGYLRWP